MIDRSQIPLYTLDTKESLCLLIFNHVVFDSEHLKEKTVDEVGTALEFLFTKETVDKVLELNNKHSKREIQLLTKRFT